MGLYRAKIHITWPHFKLIIRLNVFPIHSLSLRERPLDILPLAKSLLRNYGPSEIRGTLCFSDSAKNKLISYSWPGNVRELDNLVQRVALLSLTQTIEANDILFEIQPDGFRTDSNRYVSSINPTSHQHQDIETSDTAVAEQQQEDEIKNQLGDDMRHHEFQLIIESLAKCRGKKKDVADMLGISARTLRYKIARMRDAGYSIPDKRSFA